MKALRLLILISIIVFIAVELFNNVPVLESKMNELTYSIRREMGKVKMPNLDSYY